MPELPELPMPENFPDFASYEEAFVYWAIVRYLRITKAALDVASTNWREHSK